MTAQLNLLDRLVASLPPRLYLCRVDPKQRMSRFYVLAIEPTLFGGYCLVREYGRIGSGGRVMRQFFATVDEALEEYRRLRRVKTCRGYV
ncbi:WGR domain-containing protein [Jiella pacifica]|uniref:WGR domain-containing protein n=1 Tax=Jiella pacifica TaxID=2696469 RepID=A0A6N9T608_9HYPH|nr:WGR domain-containing protein [Jiella pacifica]MAU95490.1 WGR domain-containing protein [Fulvimarina sp.]NDW06803.1 WGR domain-containing protein [Jiella pacifica]